MIETQTQIPIDGEHVDLSALKNLPLCAPKVGGHYITRDGHFVGPMKEKIHHTWPWWCGEKKESHNSWLETGSHFFGSGNPRDLVMEVYLP